MTTPARNPRRTKTVRFSPVLLAVALTPVFLQTSTVSCKSGDTTLSELEVIVGGQGVVDGFDPDVRNYSAAVPAGTNEAMVHAMSTDPNAQVWIDVVAGGERERYLHGGLGGGDMVVSLPPGPSTIEVWVRAPKGASGVYAVSVDVALEFPCTEQGIRDAIALGGGPHTFDCNGPTVVTTQAEIAIDNDVILDGEGNLTVRKTEETGSPNRFTIFAVPLGVTAELRALSIEGGIVTSADEGSASAIFNAGTLTLVDTSVANNQAFGSGGGRIVDNTGTLTLSDSIVTNNSCEYDCIANSGDLLMTDTSFVNNNSLRGDSIHNFGGNVTLRSCAVTDNTGDGVVGVRSDGDDASLLLTDTSVTRNTGTTTWPIVATGSATLVRSTVSMQPAGPGNLGAIQFDNGVLTLINSTVSEVTPSSLPGDLLSIGADATLILANSTVAWSGSDSSARGIGGAGNVVAMNSIVVGGCSVASVTSNGGNIESEGDTCGFDQTNDQPGVFADQLALGPLQDNGGPTETHALMSGSIAIDTVPGEACLDASGQPLTQDQRGMIRPFGPGCDAGAFEATQHPCTEQGIRDAIALGGGPHTFDCGGPATVVTQAEIVIDNDVVLDGEGNLTLDGQYDHRLFSVPLGTSAEIHGMTLTGGGTSATTPGGAIQNDGVLVISDSVISNNSSLYLCCSGGGITNTGELTVAKSKVSNNSTSHAGGGGGILHTGGTAILIETEVTGNQSAGTSGGIKSSASITLVNSTVWDNFSDGPSITSDGEATLINSTVSGNRGVSGAAIRTAGRLTLLSSTIAGRTYGVLAGGEVWAANSIVTTIHTAGSPRDGCGEESPTTFVSGGGNIETEGDGCGFTDPTDLVNVTAAELNLAPLGDYGGPTPTHALLPGSLAIDHVPTAMCVDQDGLPLTTDQRGIARPQGASCDVGAFEYVDCTGSSCDDGNDCTVDSCNPLDDSWCVNNALPDGTFCGIDGVCEAGACRERSWGAPALIGTADACAAANLDVIVDTNGDVAALWSDWEATDYYLRSNRYESGAGWGTADVLASSADGFPYGAAVAAAASGNVTAAWATSDGFRDNVWASRYTAGVGWGASQLIETNDSGDASPPPALTVDPNGNVTAVWSQSDGIGSGIWSNRYTPSVGWGGAELIATDGGAAESWGLSRPQVAVDPDGNVTAVWIQKINTMPGRTRIDVWANRYTPGGGWGTAELIETNDRDSVYTDPVSEAVRVAVDRDGNAVAVWNHASSLDTTERNVWANRYEPGVGWGTAELIDTQTPHASQLRLAIDSNGNATAVWNHGAGTQVRTIWANRYTAGDGWSVAERLDTHDPTDIGGGAYSPNLGVDGHGRVTVVWEERERFQDSDIWWDRYTPGVGWGTAQIIELNGRQPRVAMEANGNLTMIWRTPDSGDNCGGVWAKRFE